MNKLLKNHLLFIVIFVINLMLFVNVSAEFLYKKEFNDLFNLLIKEYWDESGNWKGDMAGDANWFGVALLYEMGTDKKDADLITLATKSAQWSQKLFLDFDKTFTAGKELNSLVETIGGLPGIFYGYKYTKRDDFKESLEKFIKLEYSLAKSPSSESLIKSIGFDYIVLLAATSYTLSQVYLETKEEKYKTQALKLLETADIVYWNEDEKYYGNLWDWAECSMLLALSGAYEITKEEKYLQRAKELLQTIITKMWDEKEGGIKTPEHFELKDAKVLSGNNIFVTALIQWYKLTKDEEFLKYVEKTMDFIFSKTLFDGKIIYHHFDKNGRAKYFCTGCLLHTLLNIYELNKILGNK